MIDKIQGGHHNVTINECCINMIRNNKNDKRVRDFCIVAYAIKHDKFSISYGSNTISVELKDDKTVKHSFKTLDTTIDKYSISLPGPETSKLTLTFTCFL